MDSRTELLLALVDSAYERKAWHGTTLRGSLRGLLPELALWKPYPTRHSVWELLLHAAYWKYTIRRRLRGDAPGSFARRPADWPAVPRPGTKKQLKEDVALLREEHALFRDAVEAFPAARLTKSVGGTTGLTYASCIQGVAAHDLYHTGQIQLLKRLYEERAGRRKRKRTSKE